MKRETFNTSRYQLDIELDEKVGIISIKDNYSGVKFSDSEYRYSAYIDYEGRITRLEGLYNPILDEELPERGGKILTITGFLGASQTDLKIEVKHRIYIPDGDEFFEDQIIVSNQSSNEMILRAYRFAFRKRLEKPKKYGGPGIDIEKYRLVALPFRLQPDGKKHDYQLEDLYLGRYQFSVFESPSQLKEEVVDIGRSRSEGWAWTDGENGLLIIKYNPEQIEYSTLATEHIGDDVFLNFGGSAPVLYSEPLEGKILASVSKIAFGQTRYHFYEGLWRRGSYMFRDYISSLGHVIPDNYNPPLVWSTEYDIGLQPKRNAQISRYDLDGIEREAKKAKEMGCEALFLSAGWEDEDGSSRWDEEKLGEADITIRNIKEEFGLKIGFRCIGRSYGDEYPGMYRTMYDNSIGYFAPYKSRPFYEPCYCFDKYQEEKIKRVSKLVDSGMDFIVFDAFDWRGRCFDEKHNHQIPTTPGLHSKAVFKMIEELKTKYPYLFIETHDPVWSWGVRYLPIYYMYSGGDTFEAVWSFKFARNPLDDLLSGKALSLFYYNLCYDIPLFTHINLNKDNEECLAFWWYASTVRHLGIGGKKTSDGQFEAYKKAVSKYLKLKDLYTRGTFYGLDELLHIHTLPDIGRAVINAYNLTDATVSRDIEIILNEIGLLDEVVLSGAEGRIADGKVNLHLEIKPYSPAIITLEPLFSH